MTLTQVDFDQLEEIFVTKAEFSGYRSELMNKLDEILKEILASRQEKTILAHQVSGHEDRVTALGKAVS